MKITEEERLTALSSPKKRIKFLERVYANTLATTYLPYVTITALDTLLEDTLNNEREIPLIKMCLTRYFEQKIVNPNIRLFKGKKTSVYEFRLFGDLYEFKHRQGTCHEQLIVDIELDQHEVTLDFKIDSVPEKKHYTFTDLTYLRQITAKKFKKAEGVAIKKTKKEGDFMLGGKRYYFSPGYARKFGLVFFKKGKIQTYDLAGRRFPAPTKII